MSEFSANKGFARTAQIVRDAPSYYSTGPKVAATEPSPNPIGAFHVPESRGPAIAVAGTLKGRDEYAAYPHDFRDNRPRGHLSQHERDVQDLDPRDPWGNGR